MGFWSGLGKVLGAVGPIAAAPFTGGASLMAGIPQWASTAAKVAGAAAPVLGGLAAGRQQGKYQEGQLAGNQDAIRARLYDTTTRNLLDRYGMESRNALERGRMGADKAEFERDSPGIRASQALRGGILANMPDKSALQVSGRLAGRVPNFATPETIGPEAKSAGQKLAQLAAERMGGDTFALPDLPQAPNLPGAPELSKMPGTGFIDALLGGGAAAGALFGAFPRGNSGNHLAGESSFAGGLGPLPGLGPIDPNAGFGPPPSEGMFAGGFGEMDPTLGFGPPPEQRLRAHQR